MLMPVRKPNFEYKPGKNEMVKPVDFSRFLTKYCEKCDTKRITACPNCSKSQRS
jgi:hypothetical protein